jgi:hypothetical protein
MRAKNALHMNFTLHLSHLAEVPDIEPTIMALQAPCSTNCATEYHYMGSGQVYI